MSLAQAKPLPVVQAVGDLNDALDRLHGALKETEDRLKPVLSAPLPMAETPPVDIASSCDLAGQILRLMASVDRATAALTDIQARLQL